MDTIDAATFLYTKTAKNNKNHATIETLNSEMTGRTLQKERGNKLFRNLLNRLRMKKCASATISQPDPTYRVAYLGNVVTGWAKGDGCVEKPLATLWRNYTHSSRPDVRMQLTISSGGLKATTKDHGLTEYWAHRLTTCAAPAQFPRLFCWVYRHEGRRLRHELRCHAVLCPTAAIAKQIEAELKHALTLALAEFRRDKISRQNARLSLVNSVYENPSMPRRKILLSTGSHNYRPPLERSKSAPKLTSIEEILDEEEDDVFTNNNVYRRILKHYDSATSLVCDSTRKLCLKSRSKPKALSCPEPIMEEDREITDEKSDRILDELVQSSLRNDLLESCERAWYNALGEVPDLIPVDSDEGSLSSGCESATSTVTSESEHVFPTITELSEDTHEAPQNEVPPTLKTDLDFKLGGSVLSRVRSFERIANPDILKYNLHSKSIIGYEEVSLIPVGETGQTDFSSLKVYKKRCVSEPSDRLVDEHSGSEEENGSACSDESGYEEEEVASSVANIILV